jgi:uncharacterized membrane-anchored protein
MPRRDRDDDYDDYEDDDRPADRRRSKKRAPAKKKNDPLDMVLMVFVIMGVVGGFMSFRQPAANTAQLLFRLGVAAISVIGITVVLVLKYVRKHNR